MLSKAKHLWPGSVGDAPQSEILHFTQNHTMRGCSVFEAAMVRSFALGQRELQPHQMHQQLAPKINHPSLNVIPSASEESHAARKIMLWK
jgi:hypothetical protein